MNENILVSDVLKNRLDIQIERIIKKQLDFVISRATIKDTNKTIPGLSYYIPINGKCCNSFSCWFGSV